MRRTITDIRRRVAVINEKIAPKMQMEVVKACYGFSIESNNGSRDIKYGLTVKEVDIFLDGYQYAEDVQQVKEREQETIGEVDRVIGYNPLEKPLRDLLLVFLEGRNYNTQNPYTRPEIKEALQALKEATGFSGDWTDVCKPPKENP